MATELANKEEDSTKIRKNLDNWKFPKFPVSKIYKKKWLSIFPSYTIKDYERTISLDSTNNNISLDLLAGEVRQGLFKRKHEFLHLGLVQIAIKPLIRHGLGAPIVVCIRDARHSNFSNSLLAIVESNLSQGPFYFNCFPSFSVAFGDTFGVLTLKVKTGGIPLALTYRLVCKAMVDLSAEYLEEPTLGETTYFQATSGTPNTTKWNEVQVPENWISKEEAKASNSYSLKPVQLSDGRMILRRVSSAVGADGS